MHVWNVLHAARWKYRTQKWRKKSPSAHHRTTLAGYIFATKTCIDNRKKHLHMSSQYCELRPTSGWDLLASLGHPSKFERVSLVGGVTARHSSSGRQPKRAPPLFGRAAITLCIGPHSGWVYIVGSEVTGEHGRDTTTYRTRLCTLFIKKLAQYQNSLTWGGTDHFSNIFLVWPWTLTFKTSPR